MLLQNKYILFFCCPTWRAKIGLWMYVFFVKICQRSYCICSLDLVFSWKTTFLEWVWPPTWFGTKWTSNSSRNIQICKKTKSKCSRQKEEEGEANNWSFFLYFLHNFFFKSHFIYLRSGMFQGTVCPKIFKKWDITTLPFPGFWS